MNSTTSNNKWLSIIISFIWGFGIAIIFRKICKNDECIIIKSPPKFDQTNMTIHDKNRCYKLEKYMANCEY